MAVMGFREPNMARWVGVRPGHDGTQIAKSGHTDNALLIVHTVTAGKTLYLTAALASGNTAGTATGINIWVRNAADVAQYYLIQNSLNVNTYFAVGLSFNPPLEIPAGWDIVIVAGHATARADLFIHGWEE